MEQNRIFGLDFFRAAAIVLLLLANALFLFQMEIPAIMQFVPIMGFLGLEIFFVLCGFWLGHSLLKIFSNDDFGSNAALSFVRKRVFRIVPLYFIVVLANIVLAFSMDYGVVDVWKYFFFIQNFSKPIPSFFPESWGLPVIVFATLLFPLLLWAFSGIVNKKQKPLLFPLITVGLILIFLWTKWIYNDHTSNTTITQWDVALKTVTIYRLDSVFIGVLMAWLMKLQFVQSAKWFLAAFGFVGIFFIAVGVGYFQLLIENHALFWNVFYLPITSFSLALFLPLFFSWQSMPAFLQIPIAGLSKISYSVYLIHFSIVLLLMEHFLMVNFESSSNLLLLAGGYLGLTLFLGFLIWRFVEKPLRKRLK